MRTVVVAGGRGHLGSILRINLVRAGYSPVVVTRDPNPAKRYHFLTWDELKEFGLPESTVHVINLAGADLLDIWKPLTAKYKKEVRESHAWTNSTLRDVIQGSHVKPYSFITTSHVAIYGAKPGDVVNESSPTKPNTFLGDCALEWEEAARLNEKNAKYTRQIFLRNGFVIGNVDNHTRYTVWPGIMDLLGRYYASQPDMIFPWIHTSDWASIVIACAKADTLSGPVNAAVSSSLQDVIRVIRGRDGTLFNTFGKLTIPLILSRQRREALVIPYVVQSTVLPKLGHKKSYPTHAHLRKYAETIAMEPDVFFGVVFACVFGCFFFLLAFGGPGDREVEK